MRNGGVLDSYIRDRWKHWLWAHELKIGPSALAKALGNPKKTKDSQPRAMIHAWLEGTRTVSPELAWKTGEKLRSDGYFDSGLLSLYATARYSAVIKMLAWLTKEPKSADAAGTLICVLPGAVNTIIDRKAAQLAEDNQALAAMDSFRSQASECRSICADAITRSAEVVASLWRSNKAKGQGPPSELSSLYFSIACAGISQTRVHPAYSCQVAWDYLLSWAGNENSDTVPVVAKHCYYHRFYQDWRARVYPIMRVNQGLYFRRRGRKEFIERLKASEHFAQLLRLIRENRASMADKKGVNK